MNREEFLRCRLPLGKRAVYERAAKIAGARSLSAWVEAACDAAVDGDPDHAEAVAGLRRALAYLQRPRGRRQK